MASKSAPPANDRAWTLKPSGYPQYAAFIATDPDRSTAVYRRFERLAARNLLYLESQLADLEAKQDTLDDELRERGLFAVLNEENLLQICERKKVLDKLEATPNYAEYAGYVGKRLQLAQDVRTVLKEYCMILLPAGIVKSEELTDHV
jgi:hypothetical protein